MARYSFQCLVESILDEGFITCIDCMIDHDGAVPEPGLDSVLKGD